MTDYWYLLPFSVQGLVMFFDEFYCHFKRGLPRWERIGHPLDTLTVMFCIGICTFLSPSNPAANTLFIFGALFSCFFITKDEFVHARECSAFEHWLHSILFVLHPAILFCTFELWHKGGSIDVGFDLNFPIGVILKIQFYFLAVFCIYQISYWNIYRVGNEKNK